MNQIVTINTHGELIEPATLKIQRLLPGPIERVWSYLTDGELRRRWLAGGGMELTPGAEFELVWRNDELSDPPGVRPEGFAEEQRMKSRIIACEPPRKLVFSWANGGEVSFELEPKGKDVLLTLVHDRLGDRSNRLGISAGWHMHLDIMAAHLANAEPESFWQGWQRLRAEYDQRQPA